jgi:hypothetical protein
MTHIDNHDFKWSPDFLTIGAPSRFADVETVKIWRHMHNNSIPFRAAPLALAVLSVALLCTAPGLAAASQPFAEGKRWIVPATTALDALTIPDGGQLEAPPGKSVTLTVDGVNLAPLPGSYAGKVVLTVTDEVQVKYKALPPHSFRSAIYVEDGRYDPARSVSAAATGARIGDGIIAGASITSREERFNGIIVTGKSKLVIDHPVIDLTGNGGNDFAGYGAGIMSSGDAEVTVNSPRIRTRGAVRTALFVGGHSTMRVNDADIETWNGTLPADYKFTIEVGRMMEVPWMLGLSGNVRSTNLVDHGTVYFTNSRIRSQGWGALSTDDAARVRMFVKDSLIETVDSGYGAYSIGDSHDHFSHSTLNVADIGLIIAGPASGTFTDGTVVNSRRYGVMLHGGLGGGKLTIDKGSIVNSRLTAIEAKGRGTTILIDNARLHPGNGVLVQAMVNDDPFMKAMAAGQPIVGMQAPPPAAPEVEQREKELPASPHVQATLRDTTLSGDLLNTRTAEGNMTVALERARLTGAISTGTQAPVSGQEPTVNTYWQIGEVTNTLAPTREKYGMEVQVGAGSRWTVTRNSYLTVLTVARGGMVGALPGTRLTFKVDGKVRPLKAGSYNGAIELLVTNAN